MTETGRKRVRWGDVPGWLQVLLALIPLLVAAVGLFHVATSSSGRPRPPVPPTPTVPPVSHRRSHRPPPQAVYLSDLHPTDGDIPTRGDTQIANQDFPHSIFYDNIASNEQSNATACQNTSNPTCRATDYSIASGGYHHFSAMLGINIDGGSHVAQWSLSVDGVVVKSSTVTVNTPPQQITVAIPPGNDLELQVSTPDSSGIAYRDAKIVWGDAHLR